MFRAQCYLELRAEIIIFLELSEKSLELKLSKFGNSQETITKEIIQQCL